MPDGPTASRSHLLASPTPAGEQQHDLFRTNPHFRADFPRHQVIVSREHLYGHPVLSQDADRFCRRVLRRIQKERKAAEHKISLVAEPSVIAIGADVAPGNAQDT